MTFKKVIALVLVLALMAAGGYYLLKVERQDDKRMRDLYNEVEPLEREREALLEEKKSLEADYALKLRDYGTVEILFDHLNAQIIDDMWPVMRSRNVVGVLPISFDEAPGQYNKLTWDNVRTLLADGWGLCVRYDKATGDLATWLANLKRNLEVNQVTFPTAIYFVNDDYDPALDEILIAAGIRTVVTKASDGRSNTVTDVTAPLWHTGAMVFGYTGSATDLELLGRTDGANLVLTLNLDIAMNQTKKRNAVTDDQIKAVTEVLDSWKDMLYEDNPLEEMEQVGPTPNIYLNTNDADVLHEMYLNSLTPEQQLLLPKFRSVNFENALAYHLDLNMEKNDLGFERAKSEAALDRRIAELDEEIAATYARYDASKTPITELLKK